MPEGAGEDVDIDLCEDEEVSEEIKQLMEMGFSKSQSKGALARAGGDVNVAIENLLGGS